MYCTAMKKHIIDNASYKTCLQLLKFLSKDDLLTKFDKVLNLFLFLVIILLNISKFLKALLD